MSHSILSRLFSFMSENDGKVPENQKNNIERTECLT